MLVRMNMCYSWCVSQCTSYVFHYPPPPPPPPPHYKVRVVHWNYHVCLSAHPYVCPPVHVSAHLCPPVHVSVHLSMCLSACLCLSTCPCVPTCPCESTCPCVCLPSCVCPPVHVSVHLSMCRSTCPCVFLPTVSAHLSMCLSTCLSAQLCLPTCPFVCPPVHVFFCLAVSAHLSTCLSTCPCVCLSTGLSVFVQNISPEPLNLVWPNLRLLRFPDCFHVLQWRNGA